MNVVPGTSGNHALVTLAVKFAGSIDTWYAPPGLGDDDVAPGVDVGADDDAPSPPELEHPAASAAIAVATTILLMSMVPPSLDIRPFVWLEHGRSMVKER
jgi:hypothetical protein